MNTVKVTCLFFLLLIHQIHTMRCRSGNQQISNEFRKTMQRCKNHNSGSSRNGDNNFSSSSDNSSDEDSNSDEILFEHDFFTGSKKNDSQSMGRDEMYNNQRNDRNNRNNNNSNSRNNNNSNSRNNNNNSNNNWNMNRNNNRNMEDNNRNNNDYSGQSCSIQCFFNELNLVDRHGYPERSIVTGTLMQGVQDPMLRDFIEESIMECFHYVSTIMNQDKCKFSERLFTCFADKGREGCEDWDD